MNNLKPLLTESRAGSLKIWDDPLPERKYVIGIDSSESKEKDIGQRRIKKSVIMGSDDRPDYNCAIVLEQETGQHVATWHGYIDPPDFARCCAALGLLYNKAFLVPERNGVGLAVISILVDVIHYSPIYRSRVFGKLDRNEMTTSDIGWITSQMSRPILISRVHEVLNDDKLFTRDQDLVRELRTMEFDERGVARARHKNKDDRVLALALALQGRYELMTGTMYQAQKEDLTGMDMMSRAAYRHRQDHKKRSRTDDRDYPGYHRRRYARDRSMGRGIG